MNIRKPIYSVVAPGSTIGIAIEPPVTANERVSFMSSAPNDTVLQVKDPGSVLINNRGHVPLGFVIFITPASMMLPTPGGVWNSLVAKVKELLRR